MKIKAAEVVFVKAMDAEHSGIGEPVPAHVKLLFRDREERRNTIFLDLSAAQVEQISRLPDANEEGGLISRLPDANEEGGLISRLPDANEEGGLTAAQVRELVEWMEANVQHLDLRHLYVNLPTGTITRMVDVFDLFDQLHKMGVKL